MLGGGGWGGGGEGEWGMLEGGRLGCVVGRENESEKFLCGHSSSGHCCVLYVGDHL